MRYETYLAMSDHELLAYNAWTQDCILITVMVLLVLVFVYPLFWHK